MKLVIAPDREVEWTIPLLGDPSKYFSGAVYPELEENHPLAAITERGRLIAESMASGNPVVESRIVDIFSEGTPYKDWKHFAIMPCKVV